MFNNLKNIYRNYLLAIKISKVVQKGGSFLEELDFVPSSIFVFIIENSNHSLYACRVIFDATQLEKIKREVVEKFPFAKITLWKYVKDYRDGFVQIN